MRKGFRKLFNKKYTKLAACMALCCTIPTYIFAESNVSTLADFSLTGKSIASGNYIRLDWSLADTKNKTYKVFQKKPGSTEFQSISSTNFNSTKQVKVLNIHPNTGDAISFRTWDGEDITIAKSGNLKQWMEEPNAENPKGYGKGVIEVTSVTQEQFNSNPSFYLKNADGSWRYDVLYQGHWDANYSKYPTQDAVALIKEFILDGRGFLAGHDTIGYNWGTNIGLGTIRDLFNVKVGYWSSASTLSDDNHHYFGGFVSSKVTLQKKGLLTTYPWALGEIGTTFTVPTSHSTSNFAYGDIWLRYPDNALYSNTNIPENLYPYSNFYLTTWNNTAMIQTGHSNGSATPDEQKLMANTLFYLNQLSGETYLDDYSGQDVNPPDIPNIDILTSSSTQLKVNLDDTKDNGSQYSYYVVAEDKNGGTYTSNTITSSITSGMKGFSYVLDTNPNTNPDNIVDHVKGDLTINNVVTGTKYYLHVKAIDNAGNFSETRHFLIDTSKPKTPELNLSRTGWATTNADFNITQPHNKNLKIISISPSLEDHYVAKLKSLGYNITSKLNYTNVNDMLNYDLVIYDIGGLGVGNASVLKELYDKGAKLITIGNDSDSSLYPILGYVGVGQTDLRTNRVVKNEATYNLPSYGGQDSYSLILTSVVGEANILYRHAYNNGPAIFEIQNGKGGKWIHSQKMLGLNEYEDSDELSMGLVDYITDYISQVHVSDVQYKIDNGSWTSYNGGNIPITQEGLHTISVRNIDIRGVASDTITKTVGIDRTSTYLTATAPATTQSRTVSVSLTGMGDSLSGIKQVRLSNYSDFRDATAYTDVSGKTSASVSITIPFFADLNQNYSTRTIYIQLFDSVGNSKTVTCSTKYEAKAPQVPVIVLPTHNILFPEGSRVNVSWVYNDINNDGIKLPQDNAILTFTNTVTNRVYTYVVDGAGADFSIGNLDDGIYTVTVETFNSFGKSSKSSPVTFRCNYHSSSGYVISKPVVQSTGMKYLNIVSLTDIPKNTYIDGYIYYAKKSTDAFTETKKIKFSITNKLNNDNIIKLPEKAEKIMVRYNLSNESGKANITPAVDNVIIYGR